MATYASNTTIKIQTAVSASRTSNGTIYSCPANSYAILNVRIASSADTISVGGNVILTGAVNATGANIIYVGAGQSVTTSHGASDPISVSGVEFKNTP